jgi:ribosomal protein L35
MSATKLLTMLSFVGRSLPTVQKVINDGLCMYERARTVIVLDECGTVVQMFDNPPFGGTVDCLVVLAPVLYRGVAVKYSVVLEVGFRRFVPYAQTEYKLTGSTKRGPSVRGKNHAVNQTSTQQDKKKSNCVVIKAIKPRRRVAYLNDWFVIDFLPVLTEAIQHNVNEIICAWDNSFPVQLRGPQHNQYTYVASVFVRVSCEEEIISAAAKFGEMRFRLTGTGNLASFAHLLKKYCHEFIRQNRKSLTEQGNYLEETVKGSDVASFIAEVLKVRIMYRGYTGQMISKVLSLLGKQNTMQRKLIDQIWNLYAIPVPKNDVDFETLERRYRSQRRKLVASWELKNFTSFRHETRRRIHARDCKTFSVLGSVQVLKDRVALRSTRKMARGGDVDDIPF